MSSANALSFSNPSETEWKDFYSLFFDASGIDLRSYKADQLRRRILSSLEVFGYTSLYGLGEAIRASEAELHRLLDRMAINVTEFFRNPESWQTLRGKVLPSLLDQKKSLRCWSAGCSHGEEAYSLAALLLESSKGKPMSEKHWVLATDIDSAALRDAELGLYSMESLSKIPDEIVSTYFQQVAPTRYKVKDIASDMIRFQRHNLLGLPVATGFDLILCRNVVIYFTEEAKVTLFQQFYDVLNPGGYLFVGGSERILDPKLHGYTNPFPYIYQKPN